MSVPLAGVVFSPWFFENLNVMQSGDSLLHLFMIYFDICCSCGRIFFFGDFCSSLMGTACRGSIAFAMELLRGCTFGGGLQVFSPVYHWYTGFSPLVL